MGILRTLTYPQCIYYSKNTIDQWTFVASSLDYLIGTGQTRTKVYYDRELAYIGINTFRLMDLYQTASSIGVSFQNTFITRLYMKIDNIPTYSNLCCRYCEHWLSYWAIVCPPDLYLKRLQGRTVPLAVCGPDVLFATCLDFETLLFVVYSQCCCRYNSSLYGFVCTG